MTTKMQPPADPPEIITELLDAPAQVGDTILDENGTRVTITRVDTARHRNGHTTPLAYGTGLDGQDHGPYYLGEYVVL